MSYMPLLFRPKVNWGGHFSVCDERKKVCLFISVTIQSHPTSCWKMTVFWSSLTGTGLHITTNKQSWHFVRHLSLSTDACSPVDLVIFFSSLKTVPHVRDMKMIHNVTKLTYIPPRPNKHPFFFVSHYHPPTFLSSVLLVWHCYVTSGTGQTFPSRWPMSSHNKDIWVH